MDRIADQPAPYIPANILVQLKHMLRRRLDDAVEDVFQRACLMGDLRTAEELLGVLENMEARRMLRYETDRRAHDDTLTRLRENLRQRQQREENESYRKANATQGP